MPHPWEDEAGESCPACNLGARGTLCEEHAHMADHEEDGERGHKEQGL